MADLLVAFWQSLQIMMDGRQRTQFGQGVIKH